MRDDPTVVALVARAARGDQAAWDEIVERYAPLVFSICAQLSNDHREDVGQQVAGAARNSERLGTGLDDALRFVDNTIIDVEISEKLQIPTGSIGPRRARRPERLRKYRALPGLGEAYLQWAGGEHCA